MQLILSFLLLFNTQQQKKEIKLEDFIVGEVKTTVDQNGIKRIASSSVVSKLPPEKIWKILTSYDTMEEFLPSVTNSTLLKKENRTATVDYSMTIAWQQLRFVQECVESENNQYLTFKTLKGDLKNYEGSWKLEPMGNQTKITYNISVDYDSILPDWLLNKLMKTGISYLVETIVVKAAN